VIKELKQKLQFQLNSVQFGVDNTRPNYMPFSGVCAYVNRITDGIPGGSVYKPMMLDKAAVMEALPTFIDMPVNVSWEEGIFDDITDVFDRHNQRFVIGAVDTAEIRNENEVYITGHLFNYNFYDVCEFIQLSKKSLGFSIEILMDIDDKEDHAVAKNIEFTGVCILFQDKAAFKSTYMAAQKRKEVDKMEFTKEDLQKMFADLMTNVNASIASIKTDVETLTVSVGEVKDNFAKLEADKVEKEKLAKERLEAEAQEKTKLEAEEKAKAELAEKERLADEEAKRKSTQFGVIPQFKENVDEKQKTILNDASLTGSQQFQKLIALREQK
jgi:hypothetical protein